MNMEHHRKLAEVILKSISVALEEVGINGEEIKNKFFEAFSKSFVKSMDELNQDTDEK